MDTYVSTTAAVAASSSSVVERTTDHTIAYETWSGYNSTWKYFKVRAAWARAAWARAASCLCSPALCLAVADVGGRDGRLV